MKRPDKNPLIHSSPQKFVETVRQLLDTDEDRRENDRIPNRLSLSVQPLNDDFGPEGEAFWAISSDISKRGMGFISDDPVFCGYVKVRLAKQDVTVIAKVRHSTSIGTQYPLHLIGIEFLEEFLD